MYKKLPETLFKHKDSKFLTIPGFGNNGVIVFTTLKKARDYTFDGCKPVHQAQQSIPYATISSNELYSELLECKDEVDGGGNPLVLLVNPKVINGNIQYEFIMNINDFVAAGNVVQDSNR